MSIELILYLIDVMSSVNTALNAFIFLTIVLVLLGGLVGLVTADCSEKYEDSILCFVWKLIKKYIIYFFIVIGITCFIPSEKTMYLMLGAHYLKSSTLPSKVESAIEKKIDKYLSEEKK